jgi:hypothetical protein
LRKVLKTQTLQYLNLEVDNVDYTHFKMRGMRDESIFLAKIYGANFKIESEELAGTAKKIFVSNRYIYYDFGEKIIKRLPNGDHIVYFIN